MFLSMWHLRTWHHRYLNKLTRFETWHKYRQNSCGKCTWRFWPLRWEEILVNPGSTTEVIIIMKSIVPSRNIGCLCVLSTSVYRLLRTSVHSSFYPFPWLPIYSSYFSDFLFPWGFQCRAAFGISPSSFLNVWPIHLNFLFLISTFISSCPVTFHRSLLEIIFGHHILNIYLRHLFTKFCSLHWISFVTSQVSHPYRSTDFTQALNILILVSN